MAGFVSRFERFERVGSTNDIVRDWLAGGEAEPCVAVADHQEAGRGRAGRTWTAPPGAALLVSLGFRPISLRPDHVWRLPAVASVVMAEACEEVAGLPARTVMLKWPNDLVAPADDGSFRKLAGVLGETEGLGTADPRAVVGLGVNIDWPADEFPPELAGSMTSLRELCGRPVDRDAVLEAFLALLEPALDALYAGAMEVVSWEDRQVTTGRRIRLDRPEGTVTVFGSGVHPGSGALLVTEDPAIPPQPILVGEITHVRIAPDPLVTV
jgi:BirA family biotin operon repressor/biotin-[acetyl-CoA-carboxylase] ligase